jgi:hypothetical protein
MIVILLESQLYLTRQFKATGSFKKMLISKFDTTDIEGKVLAFEKKHNIILPEQYKAFLLKTMADIRQRLLVELRKSPPMSGHFMGLIMSIIL